MIESVNSFRIVPVLLTAALSLCTTGCKPQAPDLERQRTIETHNQQLSKEIDDMQKRIREAGELTPGLREKIAERRHAINSELARKADLRRSETSLKLRSIEMETRLKAFRDTFKNLQSAAAANKN
ncbi:MAG: hypothetical protein IJ943_07415 [Akkermansia sp.]|nr:hypothetical protein [Akkermansia sp.]